MLIHISSFLTNSAEMRPIPQLTWKHRFACSLSHDRSFGSTKAQNLWIGSHCLIAIFPCENWLKLIIRVLTSAMDAIFRVEWKRGQSCKHSILGRATQFSHWIEILHFCETQPIIVLHLIKGNVEQEFHEKIVVFFNLFLILNSC